MNKKFRIIMAVLALTILLLAISIPVFAAGDTDTEDVQLISQLEDDTQQESENNTVKYKAFSAAILVALASVAGAVSMGIAVKSASEGMSRQPEAASSIRTNTMLGLVFIETAIIYALIVAIIIIFVL